jgi:L-aspartate oxidase
MNCIETDFAVVGSGLAGLLSALHLAEHGRVLVVTKRELADCNTAWAQGGVACVIDPEDSFDAHVADTLDAGGGLCDAQVVRDIIAAGPARIRELEQFGLRFTRSADDGESYDLGKEGGHSHRRVLHCDDMTGREIERVLIERVMAHPNITVRVHCIVIDLITTSWLTQREPVAVEANRCVGFYARDAVAGGIFAVNASCTVLATGGGGKVYLYTSNPDVATGDGVAIAWRAGVPIRNMEFIQFHPTTLYHPVAKSFLISEAVRGEGGVIVDADGTPIAEKYDERGSLAPRDIVARAIDSEMKAGGAPCMYLDIRHKSFQFISRRFPNIYTICLKFGIDMARDLVPIVPSAHYFCGGIEAGTDGSTALPGLFACGEVACTGLHGANRLASNSLLEALVCSHATASAIAAASPGCDKDPVRIPDWEVHAAVPSDEIVVIEHNWNEVRTCMWDYVGIVRSNKRLERAARRLHNLRAEIRQYYLDYLVTPDILELRNIADVADLIIRSAMMRRESRGLHYTLDHPSADESCLRDTTIRDPAGGQIR